MKKILAIALTFVLIFGFVSCTANNNDVKTYKIGICNYVDDASLNQIVSNIRSQLDKIAAEKVKFVDGYEDAELKDTTCDYPHREFVKERNYLHMRGIV